MGTLRLLSFAQPIAAVASLGILPEAPATPLTYRSCPPASSIPSAIIDYTKAHRFKSEAHRNEGSGAG